MQSVWEIGGFDRLYAFLLTIVGEIKGQETMIFVYNDT